MVTENKDLITRLLKQSVLSLSRETVAFSSRIEVDGIICLTVDDQDQHVVKIHEIIDKPSGSKNEVVRQRKPSAEIAMSSSQDDGRGSSKTVSATNENVDKNISRPVKLEADNSLTKHNQDADKNNYSDVKEQYNNAKHSSRSTCTSTNDKAVKNISQRVQLEPGLIKTNQDVDKSNCSEIKNANGSTTALSHSTYSTTNDSAGNKKSRESKLESDNVLIKPDSKGDRNNHSEKEKNDASIKANNENKSSLPIKAGPSKIVTKPNLDADKKIYSISKEETDNMEGLAKPKLRRSSAREILCKKCNNTFRNVDLFQAHNMAAYNLSTCLVCLATFTSPSNLKRHFVSHTGLKPYSCHKCSESFSRNDEFKRHLTKHTMTFQKKFRCAVCKIGCSNKAVMKSHMMKEHNSKMYHACPQCGESYIDFARLQQHMKSHTKESKPKGYRCSICSFTGSNALMYNKHLLIHGPRKEYNCIYCSLPFSDPFMYTSHMKGHKGDQCVQNYNCCFCNKTFQTFEKFQKHEHTHVRSMSHLPKSTVQGAKSLLTSTDSTAEDTEIPLRKTEEDEHSSNNLRQLKTNEDNKTIKECSVSPMSNNKATIKGPENNYSAGEQRKTKLINLYKESTQTGSNQTFAYNEETVVDNHRGYNPFEDSTQMNILHDNVYNEKTVTINNENVKGSTRTSGKTTILINTPSKIKIKQNLTAASDVVRQTKHNQSKGGIKSVERNTMKAANQKDLSRKRPADDDCIIVGENKLLKPSTPVKSLSGSSPNISEQQKHKTNNGTNANMQGTSYVSLLGKNDSGTFRSSKDSPCSNESKDRGFEAPLSTETYTDISEQISLNKSHNLGMSTISASIGSTSATLNPKPSNQGFQKVVTPNRFVCSYCGMGLSSQLNMERHIRTHIGGSLLTCDLCQECFLREEDLKNHRASRHTDTEPIMCGACRASFSLPQDLEKHLQMNPDHKL